MQVICICHSRTVRMCDEMELPAMLSQLGSESSSIKPASSPPCEACPAPVDAKMCGGCAWDSASAVPADGRRRLSVVRTPEAYGCLRKGASIVVDNDARQPFMRIGDRLLPLSEQFGAVIAGTVLERDIEKVLALGTAAAA